MLAVALEAEVNQYIAELAAETDESGRPGGPQRPPPAEDRGHYGRTSRGHRATRHDRRVDGATGERQRFSSKILPPWCRKSPKIPEVLPLLYLHGLSSGDFVPGATFDNGVLVERQDQAA